VREKDITKLKLLVGGRDALRQKYAPPRENIRDPMVGDCQRLIQEEDAKRRRELEDELFAAAMELGKSFEG
jgi:hypothetical protein